MQWTELSLLHARSCKPLSELRTHADLLSYQLDLQDHASKKFESEYNTVECGITRSIWHDMEYITAVAETEYKSQFKPTKYIPYLGVMGELWDVFWEDFR